MRGKTMPKLAARSAAGKVFRPLWEWVLAGEPKGVAFEHFPAYWYWLWAWPTGHWHGCSSCSGEGLEERLIRLLKVAIADGVIALTDDESVVMGDSNVRSVIRALDAIEPAPDWSWWSAHYNVCPGRLDAITELRAAERQRDQKQRGEAKL
jgi:hypothetical protein